MRLIFVLLTVNMSDEEADRAARRKRLQFTCKSHDADAQRCRLWLNGLNERANKEELIELFTTHGRVYGKLTII